MLRCPFIWPPFAASCLNLGLSCCEEEERRLLGDICRSLITCRTGRRRRPRAAAPAGEDLPGPREGVRALRRSRLSGRATPRRGRGARGRASSHVSWPRRPPPLLVRQGASRLARLRRSTEEVKNEAKTQQNAGTNIAKYNKYRKMQQTYSKNRARMQQTRSNSAEKAQQ